MLSSKLRPSAVDGQRTAIEVTVAHRERQSCPLEHADEFSGRVGTHTKAMAEFTSNIREKGLTAALSDRDQPFGDYRTPEHAS